MKLYEVKQGVNVVDRGMRVLGVYKPFNKRMFVNEIPFILNTINTPFPVKSLHWTRWYSTEEEITADYRFLYHPLLRPGDTIRSEDNAILLVEYTNELRIDFFPMVFQGKITTHPDTGKFNEEVKPVIETNVGFQMFLTQFFIIPNNEVDIKFEKIEFQGASVRGYALYQGLDMLQQGIYHITTNLFLGGDFKFVLKGETTPALDIYYVLEVIRVPTLLIEMEFEKELSENIWKRISLARFNL